MFRSDEPVTLQTTFWRFYAASMLPLLAGMLAGTALVAWALDGAWLPALGTVAGGAAGTLVVASLGAARARVEYRDGTLDAPGLGLRQRVTIAVEQIDCVRSSRRSAWQRVAGERALWTRDGRRVVLNERWFAPGALLDLWLRLGCQP